MSSDTDQLSPDLLERALLRLGFSDRPATTLGGLQTLYAAWCRNVPFDNVRKLIHLDRNESGPLPGDDAADFFEAWLTYGTGGTCWAGNGALYTLLASLGFQVSRGIGTMLAAPNIPPNHGTVWVGDKADRYIVDASILHCEPLRLDERTPTSVAHRGWGVQCSQRDDGHWYIRWRPLHTPAGLDCRIDRLYATGETFREMHEETRAWSLFNYELHARVIRGDSMLGIARGQRVELTGTGEIVQRRLEGNDRIRILVEELGISEEVAQQLPQDSPTPPPPGSQTARDAASANWA